MAGVDNNRQCPDVLPDVLPDNPLVLAADWLSEAAELTVQRNPNAMTIASVAASGQPSARIVLCKELAAEPGYLVFYTNYQSRKAAEFSSNQHAAALFHWDALGRQIRVEGIIRRSPETESDAYFATRGWGSRLGAWGSDQSSAIESKKALVEQIERRGRKLGLSFAEGTHLLSSDNNLQIPRPPHWGGYRLWATAVELWVEGADRIHDRGHWTRHIEFLPDDRVDQSAWQGTRLQP